MATSRDHEDQPEEDLSACGEGHFSTYGGLGTNEDVLALKRQLNELDASIGNLKGEMSDLRAELEGIDEADRTIELNGEITDNLMRTQDMLEARHEVGRGTRRRSATHYDGRVF